MSGHQIVTATAALLGQARRYSHPTVALRLYGRVGARMPIRSWCAFTADHEIVAPMSLTTGPHRLHETVDSVVEIRYARIGELSIMRVGRPSLMVEVRRHRDGGLPHDRRRPRVRSAAHDITHHHPANCPPVPDLCPPRYSRRARRPSGPPVPLASVAHAAHVHLRLPPMWGGRDPGRAAGTARTVAQRAPSVAPPPDRGGRGVVGRGVMAHVAHRAPVYAVCRLPCSGEA